MSASPNTTTRESDVGSAPGDSSLCVLFVHPAYPNQFTDIAAELNARPGFECMALIHEAHVEEASSDGTGVSYVGFQPDGQPTQDTYPFLYSFEKGARNARGIAHAFIQLRNSRGIDVVVGHAGFGGTLYAKDILECAVVSYSELLGYHSQAGRSEFPFRLHQMLSSRNYEALHLASLLYSDLGIVPSHHAKRLFPSALYPRLRVQMEGFDADNVPAGDEEERRQLGLPTDRPLVGFFGRTLEAVRGFDIFVEMASRLRQHNSDVVFPVIGEAKTIYGNEATYLDDTSFRDYALQKVGMPADQFLWMPTLPYDTFRRVIACLDVAVLPYFEGAGQWSLLEGMALGLPVVSSTRCFVPEVIRHEEEGLLADPYDVGTITAYVRRLLDSPDEAEQLGTAARRRIQEEYSHETVADGYASILPEAVQRHRNGETRPGWTVALNES